ncbi:trypsin-like serine protease [Nonomuraea sp. NPDC049684]|uniref:trypsin-like serine protease n=1 Tax=Nonomuraea sp. NPDC049684 TaxID=3364356 RepID=UPI00378E2345
MALPVLDTAARGGRCDDQPLWYGGVAIRNTAFGPPSPRQCGGNGQWYYHCTGGFGVTLGTTRYLLTAGHCAGDQDFFTDSTGENNEGGQIGPVRREHVGHDLLLVEAATAGRIWDGTPGVSDFTKPVKGWLWAAPGQFVCFSGTTSGARCGHYVDAYYSWICDPDGDIYGNYECYEDLISAAGPGSQHGDSGGPVFSLTGDGSQVMALGTVTGNIDLGLGLRELMFQDFGTATRDWPGLDVITG